MAQPFYAINTVRQANGLLQHDEGLLTDIDCPRAKIIKLPELGLIAKWKVSPDFTKGSDTCTIRDVQVLFHDLTTDELRGYVLFHLVTGGSHIYADSDYLSDFDSRGDAGMEFGHLLATTFGSIGAVFDEMLSVAYVDAVEFTEASPAGVGMAAFKQAMDYVHQQYSTNLFLFSVHPLQFNNQYSKATLPEGFTPSSASAYQVAVRRLIKLYKTKLGAETLHGNVQAVAMGVSLIETEEGAWAVMNPQYA